MRARRRCSRARPSASDSTAARRAATRGRSPLKSTRAERTAAAALERELDSGRGGGDRLARASLSSKARDSKQCRRPPRPLHVLTTTLPKTTPCPYQALERVLGHRLERRRVEHALSFAAGFRAADRLGAMAVSLPARLRLVRARSPARAAVGNAHVVLRHPAMKLAKSRQNMVRPDRRGRHRSTNRTPSCAAVGSVLLAAPPRSRVRRELVHLVARRSSSNSPNTRAARKGSAEADDPLSGDPGSAACRGSIGSRWPPSRRGRRRSTLQPVTRRLIHRGSDGKARQHFRTARIA